MLRTIKEPAFTKRFPNKSYNKFIASAVLRIVLGYTFLVNVFVILAQATGVLDIFYDVCKFMTLCNNAMLGWVLTVYLLHIHISGPSIHRRVG